MLIYITGFVLWFTFVLIMDLKARKEISTFRLILQASLWFIFFPILTLIVLGTIIAVKVFKVNLDREALREGKFIVL